MRRGRRAAAAVAVAAAFAAPAVASAQTIGPHPFRGVTGQGQDVLMRLSEDGTVGNVEIEWDARCRGGTRFAPQSTIVDRLPEGTGRTAFSGVGRYRVPERGGRIVQVTAALAGRRRGPEANPAVQVWSGTLRIRAVMRRHGRLDDVCTLRTRWRARAIGYGTGTWVVANDALLPEAPADWRMAFPSATIAAAGTRDSVTVDADEPGGDGQWSAGFTAPALNRLEVGRTYTPASDVAGGASMTASTKVGGDCSTQRSFTVEVLRFDRLKRLVALRITFVHTCSSGSTWRSTVDWRAVP